MPVYTFNQIGLSLIFSFFQSGPLACFPFVIDLCCVICLFVCLFFSTYQFRASDLIAEDLVFCLSLEKRLIRVRMKCGNRGVSSHPGNTVQNHSC